MSDNIKLTFIIPVYNAEQYISQCFESIGDHHDVQCIFVDDGSTDKSSQMLEDIKAQKTNVDVIHIQNGGVSNARNIGLKYAKGDWITFLDADDYLIDGWYKYISEEEMSNNDLICFTHIWEYIQGKEKVVNFSQIPFTELLLTTSEMNTCWGKLYRRSIIEDNDIEFNNNMKYGEDFCFVLSYCRAVKNGVCLCDKPLIYYRNNPSGAMHNDKLKQRLNDNYLMMLDRIQYANELQLDGFEKKIYELHYRALTDIMRSISLSKIGSLKNYKLIKNHKYTRQVIDNLDYKALGGIKRLEYHIIKKAYFCVPLYFKIKALLYKRVG